MAVTNAKRAAASIALIPVPDARPMPKVAVPKVPIFLYTGPDGALDPDRRWGTLEAIFALDGCIPIGRSARRVDAELLGDDGFLPYGLAPDDL